MSDSVSDKTVRASEIQSIASGWVIDKYTSGEWSSSEQAALDAWLAQSIAHRVAYVRFEDAWMRSKRLAALGSVSLARATLETLRNVRPLLLRIAAAFAYVVVMGGLLYYFLQPASNAQTFATPVGGRETVILADGSQIELNTDTILRVSESRNERDVALERGEAFFRVKHNPKQPFVVTAGAQRIVDVGTQFLIRSDANRVEVGLVEGRVAFDHQGTHKALLSKGDLLIAAGDAVSMTRMSTQQMSDLLAWRNGLVVFHQTPLAAAAAEYNRYNHQKIVIADADIANLAVSGTLPADEPAEFARIAQNFFHLHVEHQAGAIVISR